MCDQNARPQSQSGGYQARLTGYPSKSAEEKLSDLMLRETGANISAKMLRLFIKAHWSKISTLAHQIHDAD